MANEDFWKTVQVRRQTSYRYRRTGVLNIALLFGTAAIALSLILTPMLSGGDSRRMAHVPDHFDLITTGSIRKPENAKQYTIRRSILQETPGSVCIVEGYGADSGC